MRSDASVELGSQDFRRPRLNSWRPTNCWTMPAKAKVKPNITVSYEGSTEEDELTPEDVESIKEAIMDVIMGRTVSFNELLDELVKEGKLTEEEAEKLKKPEKG